MILNHFNIVISKIIFKNKIKNINFTYFQKKITLTILQKPNSVELTKHRSCELLFNLI